MIVICDLAQGRAGPPWLSSHVWELCRVDHLNSSSPSSELSPLSKYKQSQICPAIKSCLEKTYNEAGHLFGLKGDNLGSFTRDYQSNCFKTNLLFHQWQDLLYYFSCCSSGLIQGFISHQAFQLNGWTSFQRLQLTRRKSDEERIFKLNISAQRPMAIIFLWVKMLDKILFLSWSYLVGNNCQKMFSSWI